VVRRSSPLFAALLLGLGLAPLDARADEGGEGGSEAVRFEYDAPSTCPSVDNFEAEVRARTSRVSLAREGDRARTFQVKLTWTETGAQGTLVVKGLDQSTSRRTVDGDSCPAVASALALVAALAIDPSASTGPISVPASGALAPMSPPTPAQPPTPPPPPTEKAPAPPVVHPETRVETHEPARGAPPLDFAVHVALGMVGVGAPLGALFGSFLGGSATFGSDPVLAPELRLGFSYTSADSAEITTDNLNEYAKFTWWRGELEVCPIRGPLARTLSLRPCAVGRGGALVSAGHAIGSSLTSVRPWGELGASALLEWRVMGPLALEGEVGIDFPLLRESFGFVSPPEPVYQAPSVMAEGRLGLVVHFP
jgi:hypothetical protein